MRIKGLTLPVEGPATKATAQHNSPRGIPRLPVREKIRPAQPLQHHFREKTRPASVKTPILGCFERAGQTFSRTGRTEVVTVTPTTPLQPLIQASVKPPSPMLAPEQHPSKPTTPMQAKNAPKTPNSHPQRRWRFHTTTHMVCRLPSCHQQAPMRPLIRKLACNSIG